MNSASNLVVVEPTQLSDLSRQINDAVQEANSSATRAMTAALRAGQLLAEAKMAVPHGEWEAWLTNNCNVAPRTAQAYMRLSRKLPELPPAEAQRVADLPLREAIAAIATNAAPTRQPAYRRNSFDAGEARVAFERAHRSLRTMAQDLGCKSIKRDRIKNLCDRLQQVQTELQRMLDEVPA